LHPTAWWICQKKKTLDDLKWSKLLQIFKNSKLQNLPITESFK
jgi:hypothetical protein